MKRSIFIVIAALFAAFSARAYAVSDAPDTSAASAIVMHSGGEVIYEKNADAQSLIASTTKLMTAIVAIENCGLDDELEVGADSCGIEGSSMYLHLGQRVTVVDLLYGDEEDLLEREDMYRKRVFKLHGRALLSMAQYIEDNGLMWNPDDYDETE